MLFHNFAAFSLRRTWNELGVRRRNSDTAQYLVCPLFAAKNARQRRLMLQISFLMTCNGILTYSACKARSRSRMLLTSWRSLTWRPKWSHKCSMGERSGDLAGPCNTLTLWTRKMFWVCLAVCGRALSCWKIPTLCCCNTVGYNNRLDNSVTVPLSSEITRHYNEICLSIMMYARLNHHATTPITITFDHVILVQPLPSSPPSSNPAISKWHIKPGFVRKQNVVPLPASPALINPGPLASCFRVSQRQRNANVRTARFQSSGA